MLFTLGVGLLSLVASAAALPAEYVSSAVLAALASGQSVQLTDLAIAHRAPGKFNTTFSITVHDPDPITNATATCTGQWVNDNAPTNTYSRCGNSTFAWMFTSYTNPENFDITIEHKFVDPSVGQAPYNVITEFSRATFSADNAVCEVFGASSSCTQTVSPVLAEVYAASARK